MARLLYTLLFYLLTPMVLLRLLWRSVKAPEYRRRWGERFGFVPDIPADQAVIWVHSVSVGETLAALPLIKALQSRHPQTQLVVTTTTPTGSARVIAAFGNSVYHVYSPYDLPDVLARFHRRVHPDLLVIMETELWPNLIHSCAHRNVPVIVANARLSEKSAVGYQKFSALTRPMLQQVTTIAAQHRDDADRFIQLGLPENQLVVTGNIKFDLSIDKAVREKAAQLKQQWRANRDTDTGRPILLVASTHKGEDEIVLDGFAEILNQVPDLLLVLVPRHPERFDEVATLCQQRGFNTVRRSVGDVPSLSDQILLGDTMGELLVFFGACDIAFVGGSLVPVGGHNLIEPAAWGVPVLSGPTLFNFSEASKLLLAEQGMSICNDADQLAAECTRLLQNPEAVAAMGHAAKRVAENNRGALDRLLVLISRQF